ncbi:MAG: hypothetical protein LBK72_01960, partial [Bifidobacteriaceae bacterium]|nr:hypothetical protein [Bifidobacteriaceae bacterium]
MSRTAGHGRGTGGSDGEHQAPGGPRARSSRADSLAKTPGLCVIVRGGADPGDLARTQMALARFARPAPVHVVDQDTDPAAALREVIADRPGMDAIVLQAGTELGPSGAAHLAWAAHGAPADAVCHAALAYGPFDDAGPSGAQASGATVLGWDEVARLALDSYRSRGARAAGPHAAIHWRSDALVAAVEEDREAAILGGEVPATLRAMAVRCRLVANVLAHVPAGPALYEVLAERVGQDAADAFAWTLARTERVEPRVLYLDGAAGRRGEPAAAGLRRRLAGQDSIVSEAALAREAAHFASRVVDERIELVHAWNVDLTDSPARAIARALAVPVIQTEADRRVAILDAARPAVRAGMPDAIEPGIPAPRLAAQGYAATRLSGRSPGPRRVWAVGEWAEASAARDLVRDLTRRLGPTVEWFVFGTGWADLADVGAGADYLGGHVGALAGELDPDIIAVLGPLAPGDSSILAEAWSAGVPVMVLVDSPLAAPVRRFGGGRIVDSTDPAGIAERITELLAVARTPGALPDPAALRSHLTAAEDYRTRVYRPSPESMVSPASPASMATIGVVAQRGLGTTEVRTG